MFKPPQLLSIVIPYLEKPEYPDSWMIECLESIRDQDDPRWDVTWIGDPPRPSFDSIIPMTVMDTQVRLDTAKATNIGIAASAGDLVCALSSNDTISPNFCRAAITALTDDPEAEWWCPNGNGPCEEYMHNAVMCGEVVLRRESFFRLGGYMEWSGINGQTFSGLEDWHLWMRIYRGEVKGVSHTSEPLWHYRNHPEGRCASQDIIGSWAFMPKLEWMRQTADAFGETERRRHGD